MQSLPIDEICTENISINPKRHTSERSPPETKDHIGIHCSQDVLMENKQDNKGAYQSCSYEFGAGEIENDDGGQKFPSVHFEDLIDMTQNAEKNILLLNEARVRTLEDLDKILSEKDTLQAEMNNLKIKLSEADERIRVADQDRINMELLEEQLEILKKERSLGNTSKGASHNSYGDYGISLDSTDPLDEEFAALRKENELLKDGIQSLKIQIDDVKKTEERVIMLEKKRSVLEAAIRELESKLVAAQEDVSKLATVKSECETLRAKVENLQGLLDNATKQAEQTETFLQLNQELQIKVEKLEASLEEAKASNLSADKSQQLNEYLKQKVQELEERLHISDQEISSHVQLYEESVKESQDTLSKIKEEGKRKALSESVVDMPWDFWSSLFLTIDGWLLEKKISSFDAKLLREMAWKKDVRIRDAYLTSKSKSEHETIATFLKLTLSGASPGLHLIHIAAEMAPATKVDMYTCCGLPQHIHIPRSENTEYAPIPQVQSKVLDTRLPQDGVDITGWNPMSSSRDQLNTYLREGLQNHLYQNEFSLFHHQPIPRIAPYPPSSSEGRGAHEQQGKEDDKL